MCIRDRYEPELSRRVRSPDFAVSYTTSLTFMLEVTRVQANPEETLDARLVDTISAKLGQLLPQRSNLLIIGVEAVQVKQRNLLDAMLSIQQRAERNDLAFLQRHGFRDRPDFFRHYQRVSEILIRRLQGEAPQSIVTWINPQAKFPLPRKVRTALYLSLIHI